MERGGEGRTCPWCGTKVPAAIPDRFCPECRRDLDDFDAEELRLDSEPETSPQQRHAAGRQIILLAAVVLAAIKLLFWMMSAGR